MKSFSRFRAHHLLTISLIAGVALFSVGCKSSRSDSGATTNPLAAYTTSTSTNTSTGTVIGDGSTMVPGSLNTPVISVPDDEISSINGHDNAPLLDNKHPGWQQTDCLTCHNETTNNPDHNYNDDSLCYLCHGTNGLPGMTDTVPPVLSSVVVSPTHNSVTISWKSDENCTSRMVIKTVEGDRMEFPVSTSYTTSHKRTVTGLQANTTYYYELTCIDKSGNKTSSSSFSSVLTFITSAAPVEIPDSTTTTVETGTEMGQEASDSYYKNVKIEPLGGRNIRINFDTLSSPEATGFYYYVFKTSKDASNKTGEVEKDTFDSNSACTYHVTDSLDRLEANKTYYLRLFAVFRSSEDSKSKWSGIYSFKLEN